MPVQYNWKREEPDSSCSGSLRVQGSCWSTLLFVFPIPGSFSAKQPSPKCKRVLYLSPHLSGDVYGENQLPYQPQLERIKQVDLCLERPVHAPG